MKKLFVKYNDGSGTTYTMENRVDHEKYDIEWYLAFQGNVSTSLINRLTNTLGLDEHDAVPYSNADLTYKIKRSLDIMIPVILTKCIGYKIDAFRDCGVNKFIIKVSN